MTWWVIRDLLQEAWVSNILALLGIGLAYFFYLRSIRKPQLVYKTATLTLIGGPNFQLPKNIQILLDTKSVDSLKKSWIVLWNGGNAEVHGNNVSKTKPITIQCHDGNILSARIVRRSNIANDASISISQDTTKINLAFEYLNPRDGVSVEVLHSGPNSRIGVEGEVAGSSAIKKILAQDLTPLLIASGARPMPREHWLTNLAFAAFCVLAGTAILATMFNLFDPINLIDKIASNPVAQFTGTLIDFVFKSAFFLMAILLIVVAIAGAHFTNNRHPPNLSIADLNEPDLNEPSK